MAEGRDKSGRTDLREAALRLLARREHSFFELQRKLKRKGWPPTDVDVVAQELADAGLQSDERFAESYARSRAEKAYGPLRIRAELSERGIDRALTERALAELEIDWLAQAAKWYGRRFGDTRPDDLKEKSRRQQALARRGFDTAVIREITD
ncbi:MAG: regulatory protein RecX [Wenzhouxiangella sp.]